MVAIEGKCVSGVGGRGRTGMEQTYMDRVGKDGEGGKGECEGREKRK